MTCLKALLYTTAIVMYSASGLAADWIVSTAERQEILKSARVWGNPGDVSQKDLLHGPGKKFALNQDVTCRFHDEYYKHLEHTGATRKFWCVEAGKDPVKDEFKVKYNETNGEVFAEVVSSRLLWALGFFADKAYPIRVTCENCPDDPWAYLKHYAAYMRKGSISNGDTPDPDAEYVRQAQESRARHGSIRYEVALSEGKYPGKAIFENGNPKAGFGLNEMSLIGAERGGSSRAEIEALQLLLAFIKHGDNKRDNHRLVCPEEFIVKTAGGTSCSQAHLVLQDIGATLGNGSTKVVAFRFITESSKMDFEAWRDAKVWEKASLCQARLKDYALGTMENPSVTEAGRKFLADLLEQLTDQQITDLFTAARADQRQGKPKAEIQQWVELFKAKRAEITNARCPG